MNNLIILIVEDNPADARLYQLALAESSYCDFSLTIVDTAAKAIDALKSVQFDAVLLDLNLPDSTGLDTLSKVQRATAAQIVVTTGTQDEKLGFDAIQAGAADFLPKGEKSGHTLSRVLTYAVERGRLRAQIEETKRVIRVSRDAAALSAISNSSSTKPIAFVAGEKPLREISYDNFQTVVARLSVIKSFETGLGSI
jgi:DNA-binding NtrC family response regulator